MTLKLKLFNTFFSVFLRRHSIEDRKNIIFRLIQTSIENTSDKDALIFLLGLDRQIYALTGQESIRYGNGIHTKHRHINYHDFFIKNTDPGKIILDIGCGNGLLAYDVVKNVKDVRIYGID